MSVIGSNALAGASGQAAGGYNVERSLRFNSSDSAYLSRTPSSSGNRRTWTWAGWVKRSKLGSSQYLFCSDLSNTSVTTTSIGFTTGDKLEFGNGGSVRLLTTQVFRDIASWYHLVVAVDTTQATAANRYTFYVNGSKVESLETADYQTQNTDTFVNVAELHTIGRWSWDPFTDYFNGYLADIHFIDGQALTPSSFTEVSATTGQLIPKKYTGTFTGNSFWLQFADNSAATATTLGKDSSGLGNNWTPNNLSVTAGAGNDSLVDTPTSYGTDDGLGGSVRGNYATLNPLDKANIGSAVLSNGNLDYNSTSGGNRAPATIGVSSGKWYMEMTANTSGNASWTVGVIDSATGSIAVSYYAFDGKIYPAGTTYGNTYTAGDVIGVALDLDNGKIFFSKNGTWQNSGNPATGTNPAASSLSGTYAFFVGHGSGASTSTSTANFGQRPFAYTAPSGFRPLVDTCLPAPVVAKPSEVMDVKLYTGNGSTQAISGLGFSPDLVWVKGRSTSARNRLFNVLSGVQKELYSDLTNAETTDANGIQSFDSAGFTLGSNDANTNGTTYVAWTWDAGTTTSSNVAGSITSSVRANASAGFSVVTYTGTGSNATVGHGLGVAPELIIVKRRSATGSTANWAVWHGKLTAGQNLFLNTTDSASAYSPSRFTSTLPTSTVFSLGTADDSNYNTGTFVAYCFAPVAGYSSFGSYTGNGSADGPFVYTGFRPRWILARNYTNTTGVNWHVFDTARDAYNLLGADLNPNTSSAESTNLYFDILSNGFKVRTSGQEVNGSGQGILYAAFAESPFQYARAR